MKNKSPALALALLMILLLVPSGVFAADLPYKYDGHSELLVKSDVDLGVDASSFADCGNYLEFKRSGTYEISMKPNKENADCVFKVTGSDVTLILNNVVLNLNKGNKPYGIDSYGLNSLNIELVGKNVFQSSDPTADNCGGIYAGGGFPVHIYGAGSLAISGCGYVNRPIEVDGNLTLGKAGDSRTSLNITGGGTYSGKSAIWCGSSLEIVNADVTIVDSNFSGMYATNNITIEDSTINISDSYESGIITDFGDINILGNTEIDVKNAGSAAIVADRGGKINLDDALAILSPENGVIVSFSYDDSFGFPRNAQTIALSNAVIEYDDYDYLFSGAAHTVKIAAEPEPSFLEQLLSFFKKLSALINYINSGIVILPSEF